MNLVPSAARKLAEDLKGSLNGNEKAEIAVCPPYTALPGVLEVLKGTAIAVGAEDMHWEDQGAFTGKISHDMLTDLGCQYVILGHSEQRQYFHETDETVNKKTIKALQNGLVPIVCVGETLEERESNKTNTVVQSQLVGALKDIADIKGTVIAYEPVWAIGTGKVASPREIEEAHTFIKSLWDTYQESRPTPPLLYGGSVKPNNFKEILQVPNVDGALLGGASLKAESFLSLIAIAEAV